MTVDDDSYLLVISMPASFATTEYLDVTITNDKGHLIAQRVGKNQMAETEIAPATKDRN